MMAGRVSLSWSGRGWQEMASLAMVGTDARLTTASPRKVLDRARLWSLTVKRRNPSDTLVSDADSTLGEKGNPY